MFEEFKSITGSKKEIRKFAITMGVIFALIGGYLSYKGRTVYWIYLIALLILFTGFTFPIILKPFYYIWMTFANILGWITTRLILGILFYAILTLIGLTLKLFGKHFLNIKWKDKSDSYWNYRKIETIDHKNYENQF